MKRPNLFIESQYAAILAGRIPQTWGNNDIRIYDAYGTRLSSVDVTVHNKPDTAPAVDTLVTLTWQPFGIFQQPPFQGSVYQLVTVPPGSDARLSLQQPVAPPGFAGTFGTVPNRRRDDTPFTEGSYVATVTIDHPGDQDLHDNRGTHAVAYAWTSRAGRDVTWEFDVGPGIFLTRMIPAGSNPDGVRSALYINSPVGGPLSCEFSVGPQSGVHGTPSNPLIRQWVVYGRRETDNAIVGGLSFILGIDN